MTEIFEKIIPYLYTLPVVLLAIVIHECAHGWMSYKLGDPTPKNTGRLSFNPFKHLDPIGFLCLMFFHFGWAKPVQVNPYYYENKKKGMIAVALAGPISNFIMAFIFSLALGVIYKFQLYTSTVGDIAFWICQYGIIINIGLGLFNLIPLPPLDGSKVVMSLSKNIAKFFYKYQKYSQLVLVILLFSDVLTKPLTILNEWVSNAMLSLVIKILGL